MLNWSLAFLIIACLAALVGFTGAGGLAAWTAKGLSVLFLVLSLGCFTFSRSDASEDDARKGGP